MAWPDEVTVAGLGALSEGDRARGIEDEELLATARERFRLAASREAEFRREALEDLNFLSGDQWPIAVLQERAQTGRPALVINMLRPFVRVLVNEHRQARPSIVVRPVGGDADYETARFLQGLIRHIEVTSDAEAAYDWALTCAVAIGAGYLRVVTEYEADDSFDQRILIRRVFNPFSVYWDPDSVDPDSSDARFVFLVEDMSREEFERRWPRYGDVPSSDFYGPEHHSIWYPDGGVRIAEYFWADEEEGWLYLLEDGSTYLAGSGEGVPEGAAIDENGRLVRRRATRRNVHWALLCGHGVIERAVWPGNYIPVVRILGEESIRRGLRSWCGMVRHAKDAQRQLNYLRSAIIESVALAPKAPFIAAEGQIEGYEDQWRMANVKPLSVLPYKPVTVSGQLVPPPQRNTFEPPIAALSGLANLAQHDINAVTSIYEPFLGARVPNASGVAIQSLQRQSSAANYDFLDNLNRGIRLLGKIILDLIPRVYNRPDRVVRIVKPDRTDDVVAVRIYDPATARYDVVISTGPGFETKRQEFVSAMLQFVQAAPQVGQFVMDLVVRNMDWPGALEVAERLKKLLPAPLREDDEMAIPPDVAAQIEQLRQALEVSQQRIQELEGIINTKAIEAASRERIAELKARADLAAVQEGVRSREAIALLKAQVEQFRRRLDELERSGR